MKRLEEKSKQYERQELLLRTVERLEERDTQQAAACTLGHLIRDLDPNALSTLLHVLSVQTTKTSQFARVECLRLLALLASPACPQRATVLAQPTLGKVLGLMVTRLGDADSRVREAAGVACGALAEQLRDHYGNADLTAGDTATNPLLHALLSAVVEQNHVLQAAASTAFKYAASHMQPLAPMLLQQLLRALDSPAFPAKAELWGAFAYFPEEATGPGEVHGLVRSSLGVLRAHLSLVVGAPGKGGLLRAPAAHEWQVRHAAAETLEALAVVLGPDWDGSGSVGADSSNCQLLDLVVQALANAKHDRVKPVREAMQAALASYRAAQQVAGGSDSAESLLRSSMGKRSRRTAGTHRPFNKTQQVQGSNCPNSVSGKASELIAALKSPMLQPAHPHAAIQAGGIPGLQELHAEQQRMSAALHLLTTSTVDALSQLQQHVLRLEASIRELQAGGAGPCLGSPRVNPDPGAPVLHVSSPSRLQAGSMLEPVRCGSPKLSVLLAAERLERPRTQARPPGSPTKALADLRASHAALLDEMRSLGASLPSSPLSGTPVAQGAGLTYPGNKEAVAEQDCGQQPEPRSMEELFSQLVREQSGIKDELKLLRTMAKTGPNWDSLSQKTAANLLSALQSMLKGKSALATLTKIMPWLWALADEGISATFSSEQKLALLRALKACPTDGEEIGEKASILQSTLKAVWGVTGMA